MPSKNDLPWKKVFWILPIILLLGRSKLLTYIIFNNLDLIYSNFCFPCFLDLLNWHLTVSFKISNVVDNVIFVTARVYLLTHVGVFQHQGPNHLSSEVKWRSKLKNLSILNCLLIFLWVFLRFFHLRQFLFTKRRQSYHNAMVFLPMAAKVVTFNFFIQFLSYRLLNFRNSCKNKKYRTF